MKAARLHAYHEALKLDEVDEPKAIGPHDVIVKIGATEARRADLDDHVVRPERLRLVDLVQLQRLVIGMQSRGLHAATTSP